MANPSSGDELRRLQEHFDAAVELSPEERASYLHRALSGDPATREAVERLLRSADAAEAGFLSEAVSDAARDLAAGDDRRGSRLGPYLLLHELGRGGMGTVWLAERSDETYTARVAVKLVRGGFANAELARRFRAERQILADLRHPNIARLLDGGAAPDGTPFLVMEYIEGVPITQYAAGENLGVRERLQLFRTVCDAVRHAHASLVVHRDIKPSNILVGDDGVPKLMDFGIAKPIAPGTDADTTALLRPMTPAYASPEQIRGERVTVATDVYALGTLLYELLTGVQPFASPGASTIDVQRRVLEDEPRAPSDVVAGRALDVPPAASPRELAGDLDNIVARALAKEPERRYASVADLAEDVRRHLDGEPVAARAPTVTYRLGKFARRRRVEVSVVAAAVLLLTGFTGYYTASLARERDVAETEREIADRERQTAEQVSDFLANMFWAADPGQSRGDTVTARELLARGAERLDTALADAPNVRARMLGTLGSVYYNLASYDQARLLLERAVAVLDSIENTTVQLVAEGADSRSSALSGAAQRASAAQSIHPLRILAALLSTIGQRDSALVVGERGVLAARQAGDSAQLALALMATGDARARAGDLDGSLRDLHEALAVGESAWGPVTQELSRILESLGATYIQRREFDEGIAPARRAVAIRRQLDPQSSQLIGPLSNLAIMLWQTGRADTATLLLQEALEIGAGSYGLVHPRVVGVRMTLAQILAGTGDYAAAIEEMKAGLAADEQMLPAGSPRLGAHNYNIGLAYRDSGDPASALPYLQRGLAVLEQSMPPRSASLESPLFQLGVTLHELGRYDEALGYLRRARTVVETNHPENSPRLVRVFSALGTTYDHLGNTESALDLLTRAVQLQEAATGADDEDITFPINNLAAFHLRHGTFAEAVRLYDRSIPIMETTRAEDLPGILPEYARALRGAGEQVRAAEVERRLSALR